MKFIDEKEKLLLKMDSAIESHPNNGVLESLKRILSSYNSASQLNGVLSRTVVDNLDYKIQIGEDLIKFEEWFQHNQ
ncbi:hypothetical protein FEE95_00005 [Maribacter algarum]|uniref:Uncharacterized protein n=1 Tax=Maribacter algarum (ex Zhang et al. 2020) TaxID=2578118 RepID=A0A5S3PUI5_9FLAO|nr:hypothetical protein [Maribacter algarum]TMM57852.1 hypothetical protein FEE95_00005 [Maribacter algarum]